MSSREFLVTADPPIGLLYPRYHPSRLFDLFVSSALIIVTLPVWGVIALMIWVFDGGPPIYVQQRVGRGGLNFPCLKFRTMCLNSEAILRELLQSDAEHQASWTALHKLKNDPRVTRIGLFLRRTSLDELPQLLNVLRGEMSIVGPRPITADESARYGRWFAKYARCHPGITGLWQVSGRNDVSYRRRIAADILYARRKSVTLDTFIILRTFLVMVSGEGSY